MRKEFQIPGGTLGIEIQAIPMEKVEEVAIRAVCEFVEEQCKTPESEHFAMIPIKRLDGMPYGAIKERLLEKLSEEYEIYKDSDTLYVVNGDRGRENCLKEMRRQEEAISELLAELQATAMRIARGFKRVNN